MYVYMYIYIYIGSINTYPKSKPKGLEGAKEKCAEGLDWAAVPGFGIQGLGRSAWGVGVEKLCEDRRPSPQGAPETCRKLHETAVFGLRILSEASKPSAVLASLSMFRQDKTLAILDLGRGCLQLNPFHTRGNTATLFIKP